MGYTLIEILYQGRLIHIRCQKAMQMLALCRCGLRRGSVARRELIDLGCALLRGLRRAGESTDKQHVGLMQQFGRQILGTGVADETDIVAEFLAPDSDGLRHDAREIRIHNAVEEPSRRPLGPEVENGNAKFAHTSSLEHRCQKMTRAVNGRIGESQRWRQVFTAAGGDLALRKIHTGVTRREFATCIADRQHLTPAGEASAARCQ